MKILIKESELRNMIHNCIMESRYSNWAKCGSYKKHYQMNFEDYDGNEMVVNTVVYYTVDMDYSDTRLIVSVDNITWDESLYTDEQNEIISEECNKHIDEIESELHDLVMEDDFDEIENDDRRHGL